jgi:hypothetical protein
MRLALGEELFDGCCLCGFDETTNHRLVHLWALKFSSIDARLT